MGGVGFILAYEAEGFTSVLEKRHIFKATGGAIMGGADGGVFKWGGDFRHTWWGAGGALDIHMKHFLPPKTRFFDFDVCLGMKGGRPPIRPPHELIFEISKYDM